MKFFSSPKIVLSLCPGSTNNASSNSSILHKLLRKSSALPLGAKGVAIVDMLLGRLELFTILVMLHPQFWEGYFIKKDTTKRYRIL